MNSFPNPAFLANGLNNEICLIPSSALSSPVWDGWRNCVMGQKKLTDLGLRLQKEELEVSP
jgi:hypothetical protein